MKVLKEALQGRAGNAILPFLWVHGEEETKIRAGIANSASKRGRTPILSARSDGAIWISFWMKRKNAPCASGFWTTRISPRAISTAA